MRWCETDLGELGPEDVLVRVKKSGICGTDYAIYSGHTRFIEMGLIRYPMTFGHEYSGVVEAVGSAVTRWKTGDRVVSDSAVSCGLCEACRKGNYLLCKKCRGVGTVNVFDGGYASYTLMPQRHLYALPDSVGYELGALTEPASIGLSAVLTGRPVIGDTMLVLGTGPIGLGAVLFAHACGISTVILAGRKSEKLQIGEKLGADILIDMTRQDLVREVDRITGGDGVNIAVEATGSLDMLRTATRCSAAGGRISLVAFYERLATELDLDDLILRGVEMLPSGGCGGLMGNIIRMFATGRFDFTPIITHRGQVERATELLELLGTDDPLRIKVMLDG